MNPDKKKLLIYGANGYSAQLIIEELITRGIKPVLSGRNREAVSLIAQKYSCEFRIFDLTVEAESYKLLNDIHTVLNCAGPFKYTAKDLIDYCLETSTNYIDITGEIPVFAYAFGNSGKAVEKGIVILPGAGFDIIPSDCLAGRLSEKLPDATSLKLGFANKKGRISRGTLLTTLEFISGKGKIRKDGKLIDSPVGEYVVRIENRRFSFYGLSIPWGDVFTSYYSTGIPNVEVYMGLPRPLFYFRPALLLIMKLFKLGFVKKLASDYISRNITGPDLNRRRITETYIWGRVQNKNGRVEEEVYRIMEGYNLTARGAAECAVRILEGAVKPGTHTPSTAFGSNFLDLFVLEKII